MTSNRPGPNPNPNPNPNLRQTGDLVFRDNFSSAVQAILQVVMVAVVVVVVTLTLPRTRALSRV